ncbi:Cyclic nucleotide-binding domain-containing protein [Meloidogyne graminicola]|uniref:Cyclic nucleotide-binding domain-containing protein n=1 Tax=Meloidogyne graminicola TaxID=189291 RepID=A0A8S9ZMS4_9BILA|nr:Cyclic nucleotide-binding domain-containing protein [Meloidogyne graminicola]
MNKLPPLRIQPNKTDETGLETNSANNQNNPCGVITDSDKLTTLNARPKFKTIAKGLTLMSRARVADAAINREQQAFFNKYGISTSDVESRIEENTNVNDTRGWLCWKNVDFNGVSKWEYFRHRLVFDPYRDYYYYWLGIVTFAYGYNLMLIVYRSVFINIEVVGHLWIGIFILMDLLTDIIYLLDCFVCSRTGYLDQGLLVRDVQKVYKRYKKEKLLLWVDFIACLPFDYLFELAFQTTNPCFRFNRLIRLYRILKFTNTTEMRVSNPFLYRIFCVCLYILILIHWNACFYYFISGILGINSNRWVYGKANLQALPDGIEDSLFRRYLYSYYWATLMLSNVCEVPWPIRSTEFIIVCIDLMFGVLIFATIVGNVGSMIASSDAARSNFQSRIDNVKNFLRQRNVNKNVRLFQRILNWFDYIWQQNKQGILDGKDDNVLNVLPTKLQAEIAMHVHFETLRKVRLFQDCEAGLLGELVLKLQLQASF